jgi:serine/threonine protein kinase
VLRPLQAQGSSARRSSWHQHHERQQQQEQQGEEADTRIEFSDLEVHRQVGSGQFGVVRLVRHLPTGRLYALKVGATPDSILAVCISRS